MHCTNYYYFSPNIILFIFPRQLLDHKNNELEELRSEQHLKVAQLEAQNQRLERNLSHLEREHGHLQETREREAADSRSSSQQMKQQLQADFDKKVWCACVCVCVGGGGEL